MKVIFENKELVFVREDADYYLEAYRDRSYSSPPTTWSPEMWEGARRFAAFLYDVGDEDIYGYFDAFTETEEKKEIR